MGLAFLCLLLKIGKSRKIMQEETPKTIIGWREWTSLPDLGINQIKAKIDTGARTSALHAFKLKPYSEKGAPKIRFSVHPIQNKIAKIVECTADVVDRRWVSDSGGHKEKRYVINTTILLGDIAWEAEFTLTNRDTMKFRMLLGRTALAAHYLVDSNASYLVSSKMGRKTILVPNPGEEND